MTTKKRWRQHLNDLMSSTLDPVVYAVRWARDPRCILRGASHRRVGRASIDSPVYALSAVSKRGWE